MLRTGQALLTLYTACYGVLSWVQVHRAVLHSGEGVVVKVQRPGLKQLFDIDLNNLRILAEQLDKGDENRDFKVSLLSSRIWNWILEDRRAVLDKRLA